ncbi:PHD FINGER FAMILY PROTEIN [Salix purpurea]|uniref:PHD FINGER FAMILY PROTEIN n=1 Tax=Salix purpurea TaxID=77065 RepID=A0A9Q0PPS4_SALPP|nr:PHD FINGER FAMILY PROTEIN [Salix purpurea]
MEFVGKSVSKKLKGFGVFKGCVKSYDESSGFFEIKYEDGDFEELDLCKVVSLLEEEKEAAGVSSAGPADPKPRLGRKPKKRRRAEPKKPESGEESGNYGVVEANGNLDMNGNDGFVGDFRENPVINVDLNETLEKGSGVAEDMREGFFDLNAGFNFDLNEEEEEGIPNPNYNHNNNSNNSNNLSADFEGKKRGCFDLNLDVSGDVDENFKEVDLGCKVVETQKRECGFDLNLGIDEEIKDEMDVGFEGQMEETTNFEIQRMEEVEKSHIESAIPNGKLQAVHVANDSCLGFVERIEEVNIVSSEDFRACDSVAVEDVKDVKEDCPEVIDSASVYTEESGSRRRGRRRRKLPDNLNSTPEMTVLSDANAVGDDSIAGSVGRRRGRRRKLPDNLNSTPEVTVLSDANAVGDDCMMGSGSQRRGRRRKVADNLNSIPEQIILIEANVVRDDCTARVDVNLGDIGSSYKEASASARKKRKLLDNGNSMQETTVLRRSARRGSAKNNMLKDLSMSPAVSSLTEDTPVSSHHEWPKEPVALPPKLQLPPSSQNLNLSGIPVLDLFSVYSCLRSFSTLLFLSPFGLEEFVAALKGNSPSSLFDFIHVSILEILRKHLEHLSNEGSESASNCLRSLDWGLLDLITWPVFMVEYLLIHGSGLKPGFDLSELNLFRSDYRKQPVSVKLEILQCLCDDLIEVEAIRSELNRRSTGAEPDIDFDRNVSPGTFKIRKIAMDVSGTSYLTEDASDDWNSDECCLCKMDGNLICCDGCPAAYHAKCVGVANKSLPEGDWYCPECAIDRQKPWMKPRKLLRGAELLGVDPYDRLYFSSCGYLLVSDARDFELPFNYYQRDGLCAVIEVLKSSEMIYGHILEAIHKHWDIPVTLYGASNLSSAKHTKSLDMSITACTSASLETCATKIKIADGQNLEKFANRCCGHLDFEFSKSVSLTCMSSEGSAETTQINLENQNFQKGPDCSNRSAGYSNETEAPGMSPLMGDNSVTPKTLDVKQEKNRFSPPTRCPSSAAKATVEITLQAQPGTEYMNYYIFGYKSASIAEVLLSKSSDKTTENSIKSDEEMALAQMKVILKKSNKFHWSSIPSVNAEVQKEKCGWCFSCRATTDEPACLLNMGLGPVEEGSESEGINLKSKRNRKGYLIDLICHILLIEDRLQGLLLGPWLNPHYTKLWRRSILKASDIASVKHLLLKLEANVQRLALSADWVKHVDSGVTMGSSSHIVTASSRASLKNGIGRKRARSTECESNPCAKSASGLGMFWWRGGRLSRRLFSWKVLPCSLASKAARQAGCMKIAGILYPENSDFAKRSKHVTWQAAVESSVTVEQLALQVREFDSSIRWDEIQNINPLSMLDKELRKSFRLFKKVIIRRKCVEEKGTKYLLDFGKRRSIPEVVSKNGSMIEESSSERKKYWLNESYVPLYLLKSFEERRIARRSSKMNSGNLSEDSVAVKKPLKQRGFSYLFARAERSDYHQCGHCNKDVPIREAVCCQNCKGFFHKRHANKSAGAITAKCIYTCHRCHYGKNVKKTNAKTVKTDTKRRRNSIKNTKVQEQKSKKATAVRNSLRLKNNKKALRVSRLLQSRNKKVTVVPLRRSARKAKQKALQNKKVVGRKRGRPTKSKRGANKKPKKSTLLHKKRTDACHSYWRNGLLLSRKPDDERVTHFREKSLIAPSESAIDDRSRCHLCCESGYTSISNYISCEICGEWFHGDAFGLDMENINKLIGFRCHMCLQKTPPVCPHVATTSHEVEGAELQKDVVTELPKEETVGILHPEEDHPGSLPVDESVHVEGQLGTALDSNQSFVSESKLEAENGHALANVIENTDAIQTLYENFKPDLLTSPNESHMVEESTIKSGDDAIVTSDDAAQLSPCKVGVDLIETGLASLGPDGARIA